MSRGRRAAPAPVVWAVVLVARGARHRLLHLDPPAPGPGAPSAPGGGACGDGCRTGLRGLIVGGGAF